jgi:hypothetical protein
MRPIRARARLERLLDARIALRLASEAEPDSVRSNGERIAAIAKGVAYRAVDRAGDGIARHGCSRLCRGDLQGTQLQAVGVGVVVVVPDAAAVQVAVTLTLAPVTSGRMVCWSVVSLLLPVMMYDRVAKLLWRSKVVLFPLLKVHVPKPAIVILNVTLSLTAKLVIVFLMLPAGLLVLSLNPPALTASQPADASTCPPPTQTSAASAAQEARGISSRSGASGSF